MIHTMNPPQAEAAIEVGYLVATESATGADRCDATALLIHRYVLRRCISVWQAASSSGKNFPIGRCPHRPSLYRCYCGNEPKSTPASGTLRIR
jgi:hypothetical protein